MDQQKHRPAEVFPLGDLLAEEMIVRDWTLRDLCRNPWIDESRVEKILQGDTATVREVEGLAMSLGVSTTVLLNFQLAWLRRPKEE